MAALDGEFGLIARYFTRATTRQDVTLGVGDDAAILRPAAGHELVVTADNLTADVHFPAPMDAADVGYRSLAVNLSDLAAMGAQPCWATLVLSLPERDDAWLDGFARGFFELADAHALALVGGDTVRGPLAITLQLIGQVPTGTALRRDGARAGDLVAVSGTLGLAAAGLHHLRHGGEPPHDALLRFRRPEPRLELGQALRGVATSCIDLSDGLAADLPHVLLASGCGATLDQASLPLPHGGGLDAGQRLELALAGGDDYELCFTCAPAAPAAWRGDPRFAACRVIGAIEPGAGLRLRGDDGSIRTLEGQGYRHF